MLLSARWNIKLDVILLSNSRQYFSPCLLRHCCGSENTTWGKKVGLTGFECVED